MSKNDKKRRAFSDGRVKDPEIVEVNAINPITGEPDLWRVDLARIIPKIRGGSLEDNNTEIMDPVMNLKKHGNYRIFCPQMEELKSYIDARENWLKFRIKVSNQMMAWERQTDILTEEDQEHLKDAIKTCSSVEADRKKKIVRYVRKIAKTNPHVAAAMNVPGLGEMTIAYALLYLDLVTATRPSSLTAYVGYHRPSHRRFDTDDKENGKPNMPGNGKVRKQLYCLIDSQIKHRGPYRNVYDAMKTRLENSNKVTKTRIEGRRGVHEMPWNKVSKGHRHGAAVRYASKVFLFDWWYTGRTYAGLPTVNTYASHQLGGEHRLSDPRDRGWVLPGDAARDAA